MNKLNSDLISLIGSDSSEYLRFNRRQRVRKATGLPKNPYAVAYNKELVRWEWVMQEILRSRNEEHPCNIIKYPCQKLGYKFREIDFVSNANSNAKVLVEIKLRESVAKNGDKNTGWAQLNPSIELLQMKGWDVSGLAINVDMSFIHTGANSQHSSHYNTIEELDTALTSLQKEPQTLLLSSEEVIAYGQRLGVLTGIDVLALKQTREEFNEPLINFSQECTLPKNGPFAGLAELIVSTGCVAGA